MKPAAAANFPAERLQYQQVSGRAGSLERDDRGASLTWKTRPHGGGRPAGGGDGEVAVGRGADCNPRRLCAESSVCCLHTQLGAPNLQQLRLKSEGCVGS